PGVVSVDPSARVLATPGWPRNVAIGCPLRSTAIEAVGAPGVLWMIDPSGSTTSLCPSTRAASAAAIASDEGDEWVASAGNCSANTPTAAASDARRGVPG